VKNINIFNQLLVMNWFQFRGSMFYHLLKFSVNVHFVQSIILELYDMKLCDCRTVQVVVAVMP
jgi:hypothetical protein